MITVGIDEAGRGPLAGPVTAGCVILGRERHPELNDSKKLSASSRERLSHWIRDNALAWSVGWASHREVDRLNILVASHLAMRRALGLLWIVPERAVVDGSVLPRLSLRTVAIVGADRTDPQVMAASILAKTARDAWMHAYARLEPVYGYERHKGYPTREHRAMLTVAGPSAIQRTSFTVSPVSRGTQTRGRDPS